MCVSKIKNGKRVWCKNILCNWGSYTFLLKRRELVSELLKVGFGDITCGIGDSVVYYLNYDSEARNQIWLDIGLKLSEYDDPFILKKDHTFAIQIFYWDYQSNKKKEEFWEFCVEDLWLNIRKAWYLIEEKVYPPK